MRTYNEYREMAEQALLPTLSSLGEIPSPLWEAMSYSLKAGGKRIRPVLLLAACEMGGEPPENALPFACALEMIHTYSLIHDDLPAMDNDDLRRGQPTNHKMFGENIAILAGDGLLNAATEIMAAAALKMGNLRGIRAMETIMRHAGVTGMIAGQTADVTSEGMVPTEGGVRYIHDHKTADLLEAAMEAGLILSGAGENEIAAGHSYAMHLGLAFQMTDDLLDVTGSEDRMGKSIGKDKEQNKMTWVALKGIDGTAADARAEISSALEALKALPWNTEFFAAFAESLPGRAK